MWRGFAAVLIEMMDDPDPLLIGETTTYTLRVTNQGTAGDRNVRAVVNFPPQIQPVSAAGVTQGTVRGQQVFLSALPNLEAKQTATWTIQARAVSTGDARITADVTTELLKERPVTEVEATQVY